MGEFKVRTVGTAAVAERIKITFDEYEREAFKIMQSYAAEAMVYFAAVQTRVGSEQKGMFWTNHTLRAAQDFFAKAYQVPGSMGVTFANSRDYAVYLEQDYDGRFASFPTMLSRFMPLIMHDLQILYGEI